MKSAEAIHDKAIEFAKKKLVFTDQLVDYNEEMYAAFIAGVKYASQGREWIEYWEKRCRAAEALVIVKNAPKNRSDTSNEQFIQFGELNDAWQRLAALPPPPKNS